MKRSRFAQEQIIGVLTEHRTGPTAVDLCRKHGVSDARFDTWAVKIRRHDTATLKGLLAKKFLTPGSRRIGVTWAELPKLRVRST